MMARPTATSAAATHITKKTRAWPSARAVRWPNATSARLAALSISSMDMKITSGLRRTSTPSTPMLKSTADSADVVGLGNHRAAQALALAPGSARTPTMAASSSTEVTSKGNR